LVATSFEWMRAATSARVDMLLAAGMTLVLLGWCARLAGRSARMTYPLVVLGTVVAGLAKGPIGAGFPAAAVVVTALVVCDPALLRLLLPLAAGAAAAACWYVTAWLVHGQAFLDVVLAENLGRFVDTTKAGTGHAHGPLFLVLVGLVGLLPWTPLLPLTAARGTASRPIRTLLLAWIGTIVTVVLLSASKRAVYLLPIFPAVTLLLADGLTVTPSARLTRVLRVTTALYAPVLTLVAFLLLATAAGMRFSPVLQAVLAPADLISVEAVEAAMSTMRVPLAALALGTFVAAGATARARAAQAWRRFVPPVAAVLTATVLTFQLGLHPAMARIRGFAHFMPRVAALVPAGESLYAFFPVDQGVRYYSPRPFVRWQDRPADRDVYFLGWEREVASLQPAAGLTLEALATSEARHGRRGRLVLVRVPRGALPQRHAAPPQNG
jgi:4-amino-4-deoxy-L-arabinose transferase-like glycosyltransferase